MMGVVDLDDKRSQASRRLCSGIGPWVTKWVTQSDRKIYLFLINELEGEFESSPAEHVRRRHAGR